jgi:hypothetical protein
MVRSVWYGRYGTCTRTWYQVQAENKDDVERPSIVRRYRTRYGVSLPVPGTGFSSSIQYRYVHQGGKKSQPISVTDGRRIERSSV